ncbi:hypothetical protein DINM_000822 [Dirofilaria immitis]|nr:hypothetical protein [Dirofilaria immitis]
MNQFCKLKLIDIQEQPNALDDKMILEQFKPNKGYQIHWPWKGSKFSLSDNCDFCEQMQFNIIEEVMSEMNQIVCNTLLPHQEVLTPSINNKNTISFMMLRLISKNDKNVITADTEKIFVQLDSIQAKIFCTQFLDIQEEITKENLACHRFQGAPFGVTSSSFLLTTTLIYHLETHGSKLALDIRK